MSLPWILINKRFLLLWLLLLLLLLLLWILWWCVLTGISILWGLQSCSNVIIHNHRFCFYNVYCILPIVMEFQIWLNTSWWIISLFCLFSSRKLYRIAFFYLGMNSRSFSVFKILNNLNSNFKLEWFFMKQFLYM